MAKAFELIEVVAAAGPNGAGLQDLASETGVAVSTAHRYASSLLEVGVLSRSAAGTYSLGIALVALASQYLKDDVLQQVAHPYLVELAAISGETTHLGVRVADRVIYVDKVESEKSVRLVSRIGVQVPMHCTSMGKALLAHLDAGERDRILASRQVRATEKALSGTALLDELELVRSRGYAIDDEENEEGVRCIGIPLLDSAGVAFAAISVSAPAGRFSLDDCAQLAPVATSIATEISRRTGRAADAARRAAG